jgi:hypothetical protein
MDAHGLGYAIWNYNPENEARDEANPGQWGDGWLGEDFSIVFRREKDGALQTRCGEAVVVSPQGAARSTLDLLAFAEAVSYPRGGRGSNLQV